jgi:hypothetical protein
MALLSSGAAWLLQTQPGPTQWFDKETLFTAAGSTAAVIAVTSVLQRFSPKFPSRWFAVGLSLALSLLSISVHHQSWGAVNILIALLNGVMTYSAAVGINTVATLPPEAGTHYTYRWWH